MNFEAIKKLREIQIIIIKTKIVPSSLTMLLSNKYSVEWNSGIDKYLGLSFIKCEMLIYPQYWPIYLQPMPNDSNEVLRSKFIDGIDMFIDKEI